MVDFWLVDVLEGLLCGVEGELVGLVQGGGEKVEGGQQVPFQFGCFFLSLAFLRVVHLK